MGTLACVGTPPGETTYLWLFQSQATCYPGHVPSASAAVDLFRKQAPLCLLGLLPWGQEGLFVWVSITFLKPSYTYCTNTKEPRTVMENRLARQSYLKNTELLLININILEIAQGHQIWGLET